MPSVVVNEPCISFHNSCSAGQCWVPFLSAFLPSFLPSFARCHWFLKYNSNSLEPTGPESFSLQKKTNVGFMWNVWWTSDKTSATSSSKQPCQAGLDGLERRERLNAKALELARAGVMPAKRQDDVLHPVRGEMLADDYHYDQLIWHKPKQNSIVYTCWQKII